ncbi:MAG: GNAT family N-acetyltransferase [Candidatus Thorarchaeota archaeon]
MNKEELIYAVEYSLIGMYEQMDGVMNVYKPEGNHIIQFPKIDYWEFNKAGMTRLNEQNAETAIKDMLNYYKKMGSNSISWVISPLTRPANFSEYLKRNNFHYHESALGMFLPVEGEVKAIKPDDLEIRQAVLSDMEKEDVQIMIEKAYGMPKGSGELMKDFAEAYQKITKIVVYIGYDGEKPIAFGNLIVIPGIKGALLGGAATLPEYRGKGLYSNMLKVRKDKARELNMDYLVIQAKEQTSAPIAKKHGFETVCTLDYYIHES